MMTMNTKDDWVAAALSDDTLVADLLSRLNQSSSHPPKPLPSASLPLPLGWGHRQPRSKPKKDSAATTATTRSPTTPLSWSGGGGAASPSDGDYSNSNSNSNSSRLSSDLSRSKVCILFLLCSVPNIVSIFPSFLPPTNGCYSFNHSHHHPALANLVSAGGDSNPVSKFSLFGLKKKFCHWMLISPSFLTLLLHHPFFINNTCQLLYEREGCGSWVVRTTLLRSGSVIFYF